MLWVTVEIARLLFEQLFDRISVTSGDMMPERNRINREVSGKRLGAAERLRT